MKKLHCSITQLLTSPSAHAASIATQNRDSRNARHELLDSHYCHHPSRHPLVGAVGEEFSGIA